MLDIIQRDPRRYLGLLVLMCGVFLWISCTPEDPEKTGTKAQAVTYHEHVRPILARSCVGCHNSKAIGPFSLTKYEEVKKLSKAIKFAVTSKKMPPWPSDDKSCAEYKHSMALSDKEIETIKNWADNDSPEGDPAKYVKPKEDGNVGLPRVDVVLKMPEPYTPKPAGKSTDDYRCFVLDWKEKENKYITGFQMRPGNDKIVHHVVVYLAEAKHRDLFHKKDADEAGPGYTCYGGAGGKGTQWIAAWAPGKPGGVYPKGTGIQIKPGSVVIVQLHYNTLKADPAPDQTAVEFMLEDKVDKQAFILPIAASDFKIPKNVKEYVYEKILPEKDPKTGKEKGRVNFDLKIYSVSLHQHLLGTSSKFWVQRADGSKQCLLNIPKWDFNWQYFYDLKKPVLVTTKDFVGLRCVWDNSPENQAVQDGKRRASKDVTWGDGSTDEMCLAVAYVTLEL